MGCSDVSKFEHIYGQILTTPSCVYGRLFTWARMVDFNAHIVWKTFIDICFSIKSSLWALTAAYTKFRRMIWSMIWSCGHRSRSPMCTVTSSKRRETSLGNIETPGHFTGEKLKAYNFVISGWVKPLQVLKRNSGYDSQDATSPSSFPHPPIRLRNNLYCVGWGVKLYSLTHSPSSDFCPSPFLTRVWGYHLEKIVEL